MKQGLHAIENASRDEITALQTERLKWTLNHVYQNVPHYRARFEAAGVHPDDFQSLADLAVVGPSLSADDKERRLAAIHDAQPTMSTMRAAGAVDALRASATPEELNRLADSTTAPHLAALLRLAAGPSSHG